MSLSNFTFGAVAASLKGDCGPTVLPSRKDYGDGDPLLRTNGNVSAPEGGPSCPWCKRGSGDEPPPVGWYRNQTNAAVLNEGRVSLLMSRSRLELFLALFLVVGVSVAVYFAWGASVHAERAATRSRLQGE